MRNLNTTSPNHGGKSLKTSRHSPVLFKFMAQNEGTEKALA